MLFILLRSKILCNCTICRYDSIERQLVHSLDGLLIIGVAHKIRLSADNLNRRNFAGYTTIADCEVDQHRMQGLLSAARRTVEYKITERIVDRLMLVIFDPHQVVAVRTKDNIRAAVDHLLGQRPGVVLRIVLELPGSNGYTQWYNHCP